MHAKWVICSPKLFIIHCKGMKQEKGMQKVIIMERAFLWRTCCDLKSNTINLGSHLSWKYIFNICWIFTYDKIVRYANLWRCVFETLTCEIWLNYSKKFYCSGRNEHRTVDSYSSMKCFTICLCYKEHITHQVIRLDWKKKKKEKSLTSKAIAITY